MEGKNETYSEDQDQIYSQLLVRNQASQQIINLFTLHSKLVLNLLIYENRTGPFIFPLLIGMMLSFVSRRYQRDITGRGNCRTPMSSF